MNAQTPFFQQLRTKENERAASPDKKYEIVASVNLIAGIASTVGGCAMYFFAMRSYLSVFLLGGVCFLGWLLNRTGHSKSSAIILIAALGIIAQFNIFQGYGIHDVGILVWPATIFFVGLLFGSRAMPYMAVFILTLAIVTKVIPNANQFTGSSDTGDLVMMILIIASFSFIGWKFILANEHSTLALVHNINASKRIMDAQIFSENRFRSLFENAPVALWEEDYSLLKVYLDKLHQSGVTDFRAYFNDHPEEVLNCIGMLKVIDVNEETLLIYHAESKQAFLRNLKMVFWQ